MQALGNGPLAGGNGYVVQELKLQNTNCHELREWARSSHIWVGKRATAQSRSRELPLNM
jgi:maltoporin